jgi:hypothetical protein
MLRVNHLVWERTHSKDNRYTLTLIDAKFHTKSRLIGPDRRPLWRETTSFDVAGLLADAELAFDAEKVPQHERAQRKSQLAPRRAELVRECIRRFPGLETLAAKIDRERLFYECASRRLGAPELDRETPRRLRESATRLKRLLKKQSEDEMYRIDDSEKMRALKDRSLKWQEVLTDEPPYILIAFAVPWHRFALQIATTFTILVWPFWGADLLRVRSHDQPTVRLVEQTLNYIGVKTITRAAIFKVLATKGSLRKSVSPPSSPWPRKTKKEGDTWLREWSKPPSETAPFRDLTTPQALWWSTLLSEPSPGCLT